MRHLPRIGLLLTRRAGVRLATLALAGSLAGCSTIYYAAVDQLGWEPRDVLISRVESARDSQNEAMRRFLDALGQLRDVVDADAARLPTQFAELTSAYNAAAARTADVQKRITRMQSAADTLFAEWRADDAATKDVAARGRDQQLHEAAHARYDHMLAAMQAAAGAMQPVLGALSQQVAALHKSLTVQSVAALQPDLASTSAQVDTLTRALEQSIAEADLFIKQLDLA